MYNINNLKQIEKLLVFPDNTKDIFYFVQVIRRRKDNPDIDVSEIQLGAWYITSLDNLHRVWPIIKSLCDNFNSRAYISLIPRSFKKLGVSCLTEIVKRVTSNNFHRIHSVSNRMALGADVIQSRGVLKKSRWVLDIDTLNIVLLDNLVEQVKYITIVHAILRTPGGYHIIIDSLNPELFKTKLGYLKKSGNNYSDSEGNILFTLNQECNTIIYA